MKIALPFDQNISESSPQFIIAEVGSNWATKDDCLQSIKAASVYGANAVKFQLYDDYSFYAKPSPRLGTLPIEWLKELKQECDQYKIEFMCSCFSEPLLEVCNKYLNIHKVASAEMCHLDLLERLNSYKKPVILSTGGQHFNEIKNALKILKDCQVVLMYCVSAYPARHTNLEKITLLSEEFKTLVGFSDHSLEVYTNPVLSYKYGARVLEKHVNFVGHPSPDSPHSLSGEEFKSMCDAIHGKVKPFTHYDVEEKDMITYHHRRLIATQDIKVGESFQLRKNFGIFRSDKVDTHGFSPFMRDFVHGKISKKELKAGDSIGPGDY